MVRKAASVLATKRKATASPALWRRYSAMALMSAAACGLRVIDLCTRVRLVLLPQVIAQFLPELVGQRFGRAAVESFLDFLPQPRKLGLTFAFAFFEEAEGGADQFAGGLIAAGAYGLVDEVFKVRS